MEYIVKKAGKLDHYLTIVCIRDVKKLVSALVQRVLYS